MVNKLNSLTNNKIVVKLKAFADDKRNVTQKLKFALRWKENIVKEGENAGQQHFYLFSQCFQKLSFYGVVKIRDCLIKD